jgi:competence protein ComEA
VIGPTTDPLTDASARPTTGKPSEPLAGPPRALLVGVTTGPTAAPAPASDAVLGGPAPASGAATAAAPGAAGAKNAPERRARVWRAALRERLPLWVQLRCGIELRALAALAVLLGAAVVFAGYHFWTGRPQTVRAQTAEPAAMPAPASGAAVDGSAEPWPSPGPPATGGAEQSIVVDVAGRVRKPGIHRVPAGSRVADALRAAGGVRPGTDTRGLNRARILADGEQIVVGWPGPGTGGADESGGGSGMAGGPIGAGGGPGGTTGGVTGPISLNSATPEQLDGLPGVGPVLAQHIIDYRTRHGGFTSVEQLHDVNGIGDRRFADLQPLVQP